MTTKRIIAGVDEAGRGSVIGPLVVAGVSIEKSKEKELKKLGVKDSKLLTPMQRERLAVKIEKLAKDIIVIRTDPCKIDTYRKQGVDLNWLEAMKFTDAMNFLAPEEAYIDCFSVNTKRVKKILEKMVRHDVAMTVEHEADVNYPIVSAASIIAKVERDREVAELRKKYGPFGSGYPSDPTTIQFLEQWFEKHRQYPECVRTTWFTAEDIVNNSLQKKLGNWFKTFSKK
jgi:ribonuclease HII